MAERIDYAEIHTDALSAFFQELQLTPRRLGEFAGEIREGRENTAFSRYCLVYLLEGSLELYRGEDCFPAAQGDVLLLRPFVSYRLCRLGGEEPRCICLTFDAGPHYLHREFARLVSGGQPVYRGDDAGIGALLRQVLAHRDSCPDGYARMVHIALEHALLQMAALRGAYRQPERLRCTPQQEGIVQQSADYVTAHLGQPIRIRDIAAELKVSESRLNKTFNDVLGLPPSRYFMNLKMKRAEDLMRTTDKTVDEISGILGFSSAFHLSRVYKETFGVSPTIARKLDRMQIL